MLFLPLLEDTLKNMGPVIDNADINTKLRTFIGSSQKKMSNLMREDDKNSALYHSIPVKQL
jgi:hypothetical protein